MSGGDVRWRPLVLVIDDEPTMLRLMRLALVDEGYNVLTASHGPEGLRLALERRPDLVIIDVVMPEMSGLEVLRNVKERMAAPAIVISARADATDRARGVALGADAYVAKPFSPAELVTLVRRLLRQDAGLSLKGQRLRLGSIEVDLDTRVVTGGDGELIPLGETEWALLTHLAVNAGATVSHGDLLAAVWGAEYRNDRQFLRLWIQRLQKKLGDDPASPKYLMQEPGEGYSLKGSA